MTVGVAISTHRRPEVLAKALKHWARAMPDVLVVNHDVNGDGVAVTKNRGIAALMDAGCDHLFFADDDIWPMVPFEKWALPYVNDPQPHLQHIWGHTNPDRFIGDDGHYTTWTWPRGPMLYAERRVIERVGGMRVEFGRWGGEHREWSRRIYECALTTHPYTDLSAARYGKIWYCTDYTREVPSTVSPAEREGLREKRHALYDQFRGSTDFVDYRETHS